MLGTLIEISKTASKTGTVLAFTASLNDRKTTENKCIVGNLRFNFSVNTKMC